MEKRVAGLLAALDHLAIDLRYDERSARVQFLDETADFPKWINSDDMYRAELRERIADKFLYVTKDGKAPLAFSKDRFSDVIDALLNSRRIDPFKAWLDAPAGVGRGEAVGLLAHSLLSDRRHQPRIAQVGVVLRADGRGGADLHSG